MFYSFLDPLLASRRFSWEESEAICNYHGMTLASLQDDRKHFKVARLMGVLSKQKLTICRRRVGSLFFPFSFCQCIGCIRP